MKRVALHLLLAAAFVASGITAHAGIYHYPWCEVIRARCYAKAEVRKAECNWRYDYANRHRVNGLSKWPAGVSNYCYMHPAEALAPEQTSGGK